MARSYWQAMLPATARVLGQMPIVIDATALRDAVVEALRADPEAQHKDITDSRKRMLTQQHYQRLRRAWSEERRIAFRPAEDTPVGYARLKAARAKRAARNAKRLDALVLK